MSNAVSLHARKGREGKGREQGWEGMRVETNIISSPYVPAVRASVAPSPVESPDRMMPQAESLELLDFDPDVACEAPDTKHCLSDSHPADWWIVTHCVGVMAVCDLRVGSRRRLVDAGRWIACTACGAIYPASPFRILGPVRSGGAS